MRLSSSGRQLGSCEVVDVRVGSPTQYGAGYRPRDWPRLYQGLLENYLVYARCVYLAVVGNSEVVRLLTFELVAQPNMGPVIVRVTGPACTKDFLKIILCTPDASI